MEGSTQPAQPAGPRRSRPREGGNVRAAVFAAAERLLARESLEELTVGELAREAGVSRASFYFYFESKHAVVAALLRDVLAEVRAAASPWLERSDMDPEAALRAALAGSADLWRRHGALLRAAVESGPWSPEINELWRSEVGEFIDAAAAQIERDREVGAAKPDGLDPHALAAALIWMNERTLYVMTAAPEGAPESDAQLVETLTAIWLRAVYGA